MTTKISYSLLLLSCIGFFCCASAEARGRRGCYSSDEVTGVYTAQASTGDRRLYSYEPDSGGSYYTTRRSAPRTPVYLLQKSNPNKYDAHQ